jgi:hypothetical protein
MVDLNPPLVVWLQLPVIWLADRFGLGPTTVFRLAVLTLIVVCLALCARVLDAVVLPRHRFWVIVGVLAVLLSWCRAHFGQREHIALAAVLPYLFASAAAAQGRPVGKPLGLGIGVLGSIGFGMKPHFLLVWLAAVGYVWWRRRDDRWRLGVEGWAVVGMLLLYAIMIPIAAPYYLPQVERLASTFYAFARKDLFSLMRDSVEAVCGIGAILAYGLMRPFIRYREACDILALAVAAFLVAALTQGKGFSYHYYPVSGCTLLLATVALLGQDWTRMRATARMGALALGVILLLGPTSGLAWSLPQLWNADPVYLRQSRMARFIRERARDGTVLRLGYEDSFPIIDEAGARWTMRFPNLLFVQGSYADQLARPGEVEYRAPSDMAAAERWCFDAVIEDFVRARPSLLMVIQPHPPGVRGAVTRLDYLTYYSQDSRFTTALQNYDSTGTMDGYLVFQRR